MTIRKFAKERDFEIIRKLTRHPEKEWITDPYSGEKIHDARVYVDEAGNEYLVSEKGDLHLHCRWQRDLEYWEVSRKWKQKKIWSTSPCL